MSFWRTIKQWFQQRHCAYCDKPLKDGATKYCSDECETNDRLDFGI